MVLTRESRQSFPPSIDFGQLLWAHCMKGRRNDKPDGAERHHGCSHTSGRPIKWGGMSFV
jgi:hypothetical protein